MGVLADRIRESQDWVSRVVDVPEWDAKIEVRSLSLADVDRILVRSGDEDVSAELAVAACYDPDSGERVFASGDEEWLRSKSAAAVKRLTDAALELSSLGAKAVDEAGKD